MTWCLLEYSNILDSSQSTWEEGFLKYISRQFFSFIPPQYTIKTGFELSSTHVYLLAITLEKLTSVWIPSIL